MSLIQCLMADYDLYDTTMYSIMLATVHKITIVIVTVIGGTDI